jgi:hypothetical protein
LGSICQKFYDPSVPLADERLTAANPWWDSPDWSARDPHLRRLADHPIRLPAPDSVADLALDRPAIHLVRGPRQVGKSTGLKLLAQRALAERPGRPVVTRDRLDQEGACSLVPAPLFLWALG